MAEKINKGRRSAEEAEREARVIQEIEAHIEGVEHVRYLLSTVYFKKINCLRLGVYLSSSTAVQIRVLFSNDYDFSSLFIISSFSVCVFVLDTEPTKEVPQTGNGHGGGKKYFFTCLYSLCLIN